MEINKKLFEDVLSGKLKGTFVLKNKQIVKSNTLKRSSDVNFPYAILIKYDNGVTDYGIYKSNGDFESFHTSYFDIIDFIPDTDMKENELTIEIKEVDFDLDIVKKIFSGEIMGKITNNGRYQINILDINENEDYPLVTAVKGRNGWNVIKYNKEGVPQGWDGYKQMLHLKIQLQNMNENELTIEIPNGKIVDWEESKKQNKIILKDKQLTYEEICEKLFKNECFYINETGGIDEYPMCNDTPNNAATEHQLECILAKNQLANVAKYLNNGWKPSKTDSGHFDAWVLYVTPNKDYMGCVKISDCAYNSNVLFKSFELGEQAIEILGEETVKLALEPLGI